MASPVQSATVLHEPTRVIEDYRHEPRIAVGCPPPRHWAPASGTIDPRLRCPGDTVTPTTILLLLAVAAAGIWLTEQAIRRSMVGVSLVVGAIGLRYVFGIHASRQVFGVPPVLNIAGLDAQIPDAVWLILLIASVARWLRLPRLTPIHWAIIAVLVIVVISVVQGGQQGELSVALAEGRRYLFFLAAVAYGSTIEPRWDVLDRALYWWLGLAIAIAGFAALQMVALSVGLLPEAVGEGASGHWLRVIPSDPSLLVLQGAVISGVAWHARREPWLAATTIGLLGVVVLLQHRSVWIAAIVTGGVLVLRNPRLTGRLTVAVGVSLVLVLGAFTVVFDEALEDSITDDLADTATYDGTWQWRIEGWHALLDQHAHQGASQHLIGQPLGSGWDRVMRGQVITVSPHNFYLEKYLRLGVVGVGALLLLYGWSLRRLWGDPTRGRIASAETLVLLAVTQLVYFIPYAPRDQGMLLGLMLAAAASTGLARQQGQHLPTGASRA